MVTQVKSLMDDIALYQFNPALIQRSILQRLTENTKGNIEIVDPTNPFVFLLEAATVCTSAFMSKAEVKTRQQYPMSAQVQEDLYPHMSDRDYIGRFATPAVATFTLLLGKEEIINNMETDPATGIRKMVIPRNTYFTAADRNFSIQYPIEIRQLAHGGLQVLWNVDIVSPLLTLETNFIKPDIVNDGQMDYITFDVATQQFDIVSRNNSINLATEFRTQIEITDQFYYARVYVENTDGTWTEIRTTHSDQIYDPVVPTAVITVNDKLISVNIPQIYISNGTLSNQNVRMDIYQTKGPLELILSEYGDSFGATWLTLDKNEETAYTAPLKTLRTTVIYSTGTATGGTNALTFEELRSKVVMNAIGSPTLPITNIQIESVLETKGYTVVRNVDNITNRQFLATKGMPLPIDPKLITAASASIETISLNMRDAVSNATIVDNGQSITLTPDTMYKTRNGITSIVPVDEVAHLLSLPVSSRAFSVTNGNYLYTPFHYVLDATGLEFDARPYYLDNPVIETKRFISENDTTLFQVGTGTFTIGRIVGGYYIDIKTSSGSTFKSLDDTDVHVQLAYIPAGERDRAYLNGVQIGKDANDERVYRFTLTSTFNVDKSDNIQLSPFAMFVDQPINTLAGLLTEFDILYSTSAQIGNQWEPAGIDSILGRFLLPPQVVGITNEVLRVRFGYPLKTLWSKARSVVGSTPYQTWTVDVPMLYSEDVYVRDVNGSSITFDVDGNPVTNKLHSQGDPVLDSGGQPVMRYRKGDVVVDTNGDPVPLDGRSVNRQIDIMLIEGAYRFATDASAATYRSRLTATILGWLTQDLKSISDRLLEQTEIFFYPKTTLGIIEVMVGNGVVKSINAAQSFNVDVYLNGVNYANLVLREKLVETGTRVITEGVDSKVVSLDTITTTLKEQFGNDVIASQITGLGGTEQLNTLTVVDDTSRLSVCKRLVATSDDSLIVEADITFNFIRHEITSLK